MVERVGPLPARSGITSDITEGRRESSFFVPIAPVKRKAGIGEPTPEAGKTTLRGPSFSKIPLNQRADLQRCDFRQGRMSRRASAERLFRPQMAELPRF